LLIAELVGWVGGIVEYLFQLSVSIESYC
jgi:hypothetical protein